MLTHTYFAQNYAGIITSSLPITSDILSNGLSIFSDVNSEKKEETESDSKGEENGQNIPGMLLTAASNFIININHNK